MYRKTETIEDILAQRFDDDGELLDEILIPAGTELTVQDMGDCVEIIAPDEYSGLMFTDDDSDDTEDSDEEDDE